MSHPHSMGDEKLIELYDELQIQFDAVKEILENALTEIEDTLADLHDEVAGTEELLGKLEFCIRRVRPRRQFSHFSEYEQELHLSISDESPEPFMPE